MELFFAVKWKYRSPGDIVTLKVLLLLINRPEPTRQMKCTVMFDEIYRVEQPFFKSKRIGNVSCVYDFHTGHIPWLQLTFKQVEKRVSFLPNSYAEVVFASGRTSVGAKIALYLFQPIPAKTNCHQQSSIEVKVQQYISTLFTATLSDFCPLGKKHDLP